MFYSVSPFIPFISQSRKIIFLTKLTAVVNKVIMLICKATFVTKLVGQKYQDKKD